MKIVVIPGVGFNSDTFNYDYFANQIGKNCDCDIGIYYWRHNYSPLIKFPFENQLKALTAEVILDFQQVIRHATTMIVPEADIYVGHSAGGIISLVQGKPCVVMGSPSLLVEIVNDPSMISVQEQMRLLRPILNIVNTHDMLAYTWDKSNVENYEYKTMMPSWFVNPIGAHTDYWTNKKVMKKIVEFINKNKV